MFETNGLNVSFSVITNDKIQPNLSSDVTLNLPEGINSEVGEKGARLSGGEAQRINIARALYLEPEILILDESTSALDLKTENELLKDLKELQKTKTIIIISHRKESIVFCDKVYELKGKSVKKIEK